MNVNLNKEIVITIDGPAASGKGTVAKLLAKQLNFHYLNSGLIYRALAYILTNHFVDFDINNFFITKDILEFLLEKIVFFPNNLIITDEKILFFNKDISNYLHDECIGKAASQIAQNAVIRKNLIDFQRSFSTIHGLVTDGRDMGSVIFPNAAFKIFLTASIEVRAIRRYKQLNTMYNGIALNKILLDLSNRDNLDMTRKIASLKYDDSFYVLDNSCLSIEKTIINILSKFNQINNS